MSLEIDNVSKLFQTKICAKALDAIILIHFDSKLLYNRTKSIGGLIMDNKSYKLQTHITGEMKEKLDVLCAKTGESMASIIRRALVKLLESEGE